MHLLGRNHSPRTTLLIAVSLLLATTVIAGAQSSTNDLSEYTNAVARVQPSDRLLQLQSFAMHAPAGPLKVDALEFIIWEYLRNNNVAHATTWANTLAQIEPDNAVAIALLTNQKRGDVESGALKPERLLNQASHGLDMLPQLRRPLGMNVADFTLLQRQTNAVLSSAAGLAEVKMKDYASARAYLHNALSVQPDSAQDAYNLGQAELNGPNPDRKQGYWYLARAVDLSQGTPQGAEMERAARARYMKEGGSSTDWNQFLVAAAPANGTRPNATVLASAAPPTAPATPRSAPAAPPTKSTPPVTTAVAKPPSVSKSTTSKPAPSVWADDTSSSQPIVRKRAVMATTGPMSLGILVETSLANKENRAAVIDSLTDMLRRMNDRDEAFVLTYDNNLVFEQDLTSDPKQLEEAMESIKPQKGAVLDDAIAFAAGHLARIAKYPNRVLLVISDGRNVDSHASPVQTSAEINSAGVRIYCIGLDVTDADGQARLRELAASTGGQSRFISTAGQFREATRYIAQNLGIDFRF